MNKSAAGRRFLKGNASVFPWEWQTGWDHKYEKY